MASFFSLIGWTFLPDLVTGWTQSIYYSVVTRAGDPRPQPGTPRYAEHRRRIQIFVITAYLAYTIYEADYELRRAGSFYQDLGVPLTASEREIKSRFRRLAALHHPDKVASSGASAATSAEDVNAFFVHLKTASETLLDPARRFAYDRFGVKAVEWASSPLRCITVYDFVTHGIKNLLPFYVVMAVLFYLMGMFGYMPAGIGFERWLVLGCVLVFELHAVSRPAQSSVVNYINPVLALFAPRHGPILPFQAVTLVRKLSTTSFIGFSRIAPLLAADTRSGKIVTPGANQPRDGEEDPELLAAVDRLEAISRSLDTDATRLLDLEMAPFVGQDALLSDLRGKIKQWLVQNTIRADPMVRDAVGRSLQRRRTDAPAGAKGTK